MNKTWIMTELIEATAIYAPHLHTKAGRICDMSMLKFSGHNLQPLVVNCLSTTLTDSVDSSNSHAQALVRMMDSMHYTFPTQQHDKISCSL
jgi:hypothetical protein